MDKRRLSKILVRATSSEVRDISDNLKKNYHPTMVNEPGKTLAMIKLRDPVKNGSFYLGEVIVSEATVEIDGVLGLGVAMGDDEEKVVNMAIIDAAINKGIFTEYNRLEQLEAAQDRLEMKQYAINLKTMVNFESMDRKAPDDLNAFKKT